MNNNFLTTSLNLTNS